MTVHQPAPTPTPTPPVLSPAAAAVRAELLALHALLTVHPDLTLSHLDRMCEWLAAEKVGDINGQLLDLAYRRTKR